MNHHPNCAQPLGYSCTCEANEALDAERAASERVNGMCTACGSVETLLIKATGTRDLSGIGEHHAYPTGYGCENCS